MAFFVEFHLVQNFAPSNLNRDDAGSPKDAVFGGCRRARISSQCLKRAIRKFSEQSELLPRAHLGLRTKKLVAELQRILQEKGRSENEVVPRVATVLSALKLKLKEEKDDEKLESVDKNKTEYLLFLGRNEIAAFAELIDREWDNLDVPVAEGKKSKKDAKAAAPAELTKQAKAIMNGCKAVDVALFGRMLADLPSVNQDAACQVAHAISTHRVENKIDYFTAVDDFPTEDNAGAGMVGQIEFNSATFYRYAVLDPSKLCQNLQGDIELALAGIRAFLLASARAIPGGKQNTFAAHNPPCFIGISLRHQSPLNLANAFERPVTVTRPDRSLSQLSVAALAEFEGKLASVFAGSQDRWAYIDLCQGWPTEKGERHTSLDGLADWLLQQVRPQLEQ